MVLVLMRKIFQIFLITISGILSCKTTSLNDAETAPKSQPKTPVALNVKKSDLLEDKVRKEIRLFDDEWISFKQALADYKNSDTYINPYKSEDELFNQLVEVMDLLTKEQLEAYIKERKFTHMRQKLNTKIPEYESYANNIFSLHNAHQSLNLTGEGEKTNLLQNTAIYMVVFGSLGVIANSAKLINGQFLEIPSKYTSLKSLQRGKNIAGIVGLGLATWALTVGALIISSDEPSEALTKHAQVNIAASAAIFTVLAIGGATIALSPKAVSIVVDRSRNYLWEIDRHKIELKMKANIPLTSKEKRFYKMSQLDFQKVYNNEIYQKIVKNRYRTTAGLTAIVGAGIASGMAYWSSQLSLAKEFDIRTVTAAKVARAFIAFEEFEKRGIWH